MGFGRLGSRLRARATEPLALLLALAATLLWPGAALAKSGATITGQFGDSCRDFEAHAYREGTEAPKDISHVVIHYDNGEVVKDESVAGPEYLIDGGEREELAFVIVKSGTTTSDPFTCTVNNSPPIAVLEVKAPEGCFTLHDGLVDCDGRVARTTWARSFVPTVGFGIVRFFCDGFNDSSCVDHVTPCAELDLYALCQITYTYRATSSSDPDNNIVSWEIDFGDGTSTGPQSWPPPAEVSHEYSIQYCPTCSRQPATLTVTDSAGHSDSDAQFVHHQYPD